MNVEAVMVTRRVQEFVCLVWFLVYEMQRKHIFNGSKDFFNYFRA